MLKEKPKIKFGDKVKIVSGFYEGQTAVLTYFCPETGCLCGYIDGDGTEQMHYFYEDQLELVDRGYFFPYSDLEEVEEEIDEAASPAKLYRLTPTDPTSN